MIRSSLRVSCVVLTVRHVSIDNIRTTGQKILTFQRSRLERVQLKTHPLFHCKNRTAFLPTQSRFPKGETATVRLWLNTVSCHNITKCITSLRCPHRILSPLPEFQTRTRTTMSENVAASAGLVSTDQIHGGMEATNLPRRFDGFDLATALLLGAITAIALWTFHDYAVSNDEGLQHHYGQLILEYYRN